MIYKSVDVNALTVSDLQQVIPVTSEEVELIEKEKTLGYNRIYTDGEGIHELSPDAVDIELTEEDGTVTEIVSISSIERVLFSVELV